MGRRLHYIHDLHKKYGSVVQIGPREIDVADPELYNQIHRIGSGFLKDPWYQAFRVGGGAGDVFSMIDPKAHSNRRRLFAPLWTNSALHANWETAIAEKGRMAVMKIKQEALYGEADVFKWWTFMTTDVISHLAFGESMDMLKQGTRNEYMDDIEEATKIAGFLVEFPLLRPLLGILPIQAVQRALSADVRVQEYGRAAVTNAKSGSLTTQNVFSRIIAENEKEGGLSDWDVSYEAGGFIVAGSGTTAVTLTYLVWAVLSDSGIQAKLESEVCELPEGFTDAQLEKLPYLNAVIDETLRLYGAAPGSLPRQPSKGGAMIGDLFIPEGATVSSQAYTLHRDENVYMDAERYMPERFIGADGLYSPAKGSWAPFGAGSRTCLGMHLAKLELRLGTAEFFRECCGARLADSMTTSDMEIGNFFLISPKGNRCCVTLR